MVVSPKGLDTGIYARLFPVGTLRWLVHEPTMRSKRSIASVAVIPPPADPARVSELRLSPAGRALLDIVRVLAALYVMASHAFGGPMAHFAQEAVITFFLLSGFVIFYNEAGGRPGYWGRRAKRIYPTLLGAMLIALFIAWTDGRLRDASLGSFVGTLLGLQDEASLKPGVLMAPFLGNSPLWSLSYELWFYAAFPLALRLFNAAPVRTNHAIGIACTLLYASFIVSPNHFSLVGSYFLLWWAGAVAADSYRKGQPFPRTVLAWMLVWCGVALIPVVMASGKFGAYPILPLRHMAVGLAMIMLAHSPLRHWLARLAQPTARLAYAAASISFGIYVVHWPLLIQSHLVERIGMPMSLLVVLAAAWAIDALPASLWRSVAAPRVS